MDNPRKIVIVGSAYPLRGGLSAFNERLARELIRQGHEVTIFTFSLQYPRFLFPGKTQYSSDPPPEDLDIRVCINSINPLSWISAGKKIKKLKPDLVIIKFWIPFMAPCLGNIARIIRKNGHSKVITVIDNIIPHEKRPGDKMLAGYWVNSVDGFVTMSRSVLTELDIFDSTKPRKYSPHPLYDNFGEVIEKVKARQMLGLNPGDRIILFFGFIRDYKGLDLLLEAMAYPAIKELDVKLLVAGEFYTDSKPYYDLVRKYNLKENVIMTGDFVPDIDVAKHFSACDLVVQPYKHATQSGVTQIAYHFEKPMITTNVGGLAEIVPDGKVGYVVEPSADRIAFSVERFFREEKVDEFAANISFEKSKYSWDVFIASLNEIYYNCKKNDEP